jgi:hypothetical protein
VDSLARPGGKRHRVHHHWIHTGWKTIGAIQRNRAQSIPYRSTLELR